MSAERGNVSRRRFLRALTGVAALTPATVEAALGPGARLGLAMGAGSTHGAGSNRTGNTHGAGAGTPLDEGASRLGTIGIQLYTVRGLMEQDVEGTLAALARIGYREVELAGLHGRSARAMRSILDRLELTAPAGHISLQQIRDDMGRVLEDAATLGHRYVVCPYIDSADRSVSGYRRVAELFDGAARAADRVELGFAYHNHDFEFAPLPDGSLPYDLLLAETDPALVQMEMDLFWITKGGADPLAYFSRHPGRFPLVHVKDMAADGEMVNVGEGTIDFARIFARSEQAGIRHYFVEHDQPSAPLDDVKASYEYLRRLDV